MKRKLHNATRRTAALLLLSLMFLLICSCNSSSEINPSGGPSSSSAADAQGEQAGTAKADAQQAGAADAQGEQAGTAKADAAAEDLAGASTTGDRQGGMTGTATEDATGTSTTAAQQGGMTGTATEDPTGTATTDTQQDTAGSGLYTCHTEAQAAYLAGDYKLYKTYANGTEELSSPVPYVLPNGEEMYNLKLDETYLFTYKDGAGSEQKVEVVTDALPPRNLYVKGVTNVRDLGGWSAADGHKVKQGLIFRSSKFNTDESSDLLIEPEGIDTMVNVLGVRTEIDLREDDERGGIKASPLGENVRYISIPMSSGGNIILLNKDVLPELFEIFADEANYPIVFHCSIGTDRTGMVAFLLNGLLGVAEDDLYRDFLFSNFGMIGKLRTPSIIKTYIQTVEMASGADLSAKVYTYLKDAGVSEENLESVKRIMTE